MKNILWFLFFLSAYQADAQSKQCVTIGLSGSSISVSIQETNSNPFILGFSDIVINTGGLSYTTTPGVGGSLPTVNSTSFLPSGYAVDVFEISPGQLGVSIVRNSGSQSISLSGVPIVSILITGTGTPVQSSSNIFKSDLTPVPSFCAPAALPLEWLSFKANLFTTQTSSKVALEWSTASEKNVKGFRVERSGDGKDFQSVGEEVEAQNTAGKHIYTVFDEKPLFGVSYYRIRQTDFDGKTSVSKVQSVSIDKQKQIGKFTFYPNPIDRSTPLSILTDVQEEYIFRVVDMTGRTIYNTKLKGNSELKNLKLTVSGTYLYEIVTGDQHISGKIFVAE